MFRLAPGQSARYRVRPVGGLPRPELQLEVTRPDEGRSTQLELCLYDAGGTMVDSGRVPIDAGYMAVLKALRDQFNSVSNWREDKEFDLIPEEGEITMGRARES